MRYRKLGNSDLKVSEIALGSWLTYSGGVEAEQTRTCTEAAFDVGINFFDTANVYGQGAAEMALAWVLRRREVAAAIIGASRPEQVSANAKASGITLSQETLGAIDKALGDVPVRDQRLAPAATPGIMYRSSR